MRKIFFSALAAALAALSIAAGAARADIIIATAGSMKGPFAIFGEQIKRGAEQAVADLNAVGGVLGERVKILVRDDACDPDQAVAVANSLVNKGVSFMAGHFCSGASIAAAAVYNTENILQISPASSHPALTERGLGNVYRVCGRDDQQGAIAGNYLADNFDGRNIAIAHDNQGYSKDLADAAKAQLNSRGMNETIYDTVRPGQDDYSAFVGKLKAKKIEVLYYGGYYKEAALIVREMRAQGMSTILLSGDDLATRKYWEIAGAAGEGTLMTFALDPRNLSQARPVIDAMRKHGFEPEGYTLYAYAAIQVWAQAVAKARSTELKKLTRVLKEDTFRTVLGDIAFDAKGDVKRPGYVWYKWHEGKFAAK